MEALEVLPQTYVTIKFTKTPGVKRFQLSFPLLLASRIVQPLAAHGIWKKDSCRPLLAHCQARGLDL